MTVRNAFLMLALLVSTRVGMAASVEISTPLIGAWFNEVTPGQGLMIDVLNDDSLVFAAWFTFEAATGKIGASEHRWVILQGPVVDREARLDIFQANGGVFNTPTEVETIIVGAATLSFSDCNHGELVFRPLRNCEPCRKPD